MPWSFNSLYMHRSGVLCWCYKVLGNGISSFYAWESHTVETRRCRAPSQQELSCIYWITMLARWQSKAKSQILQTHRFLQNPSALILLLSIVTISSRSRCTNKEYLEPWEDWETARPISYTVDDSEESTYVPSLLQMLPRRITQVR